MSEKSEKWRKEFRSWRSMYPNLVIRKSNKSNEEKEKFISERKHIKIDLKSKKIIGFDGNLHTYNELSLAERYDLMLQNKYRGDKLWEELNSEEFEPEQ